MKEKAITPPSPEAEKELHDIVHNVKTEVKVRDTTFRVGGIYNDTLDKITSILIDADAAEREESRSEEKMSQSEKEHLERIRFVRERKVTAKCAAAIVLNGFFRIRLLWWLVWRWFFYVRQYTDEEFAPLIVELKKKADSERTAFLVNTTFLIDVRTTTMTMTRKEASRIRQELITDGLGRQQSLRKGASSSRTSSNPDDSSSDS